MDNRKSGTLIISFRYNDRAEGDVNAVKATLRAFRPSLMSGHFEDVPIGNKSGAGDAENEVLIYGSQVECFPSDDYVRLFCKREFLERYFTSKF